MLESEVARLVRDAPMPAVAVGVFGTDDMLLLVDGVADLTAGRRADMASWWDLASLTKTLVTLPEVLALVDSGLIYLDQPVGQAWRRAAGRPVGAATIRQLLSHNAGFPAIAELFRSTSGREHMVDAVLNTPLERPIGGEAVYSDLGFIVLGRLVEDLTGRSLAELARARTGLSYRPPPGAAVATELCPWRERLIVGEVHDENSYAMGGVAGHAGAFGTLALVTEAARAWLGRQVVSPRLHEAARTCWASNRRGERFGLGWWLAPTRGLGGPVSGAEGYGCSGFVGNRIWLEPEYGYGVVILSNRVHPLRRDRAPFMAWCARLLATVADALR